MKFKKIIPIIIIIITLLIFNQIINKCSSDKAISTNIIDSLKVKNIELENQIAVNNFNLKHLKSKSDSLLLVKQKVVVKYKSIKDTVIKYYHNDSIIMQYVDICDTMHQIQHKELVLKDSIINNLESTVLLKDFQLNNKDIEINEHIAVNKSLKKNLGKQRIKTFLVGLIGVGATSSILYYITN
jgi:hypothetical protein